MDGVPCDCDGDVTATTPCLTSRDSSKTARGTREVVMRSASDDHAWAALRQQPTAGCGVVIFRLSFLERVLSCGSGLCSKVPGGG